MHPAEFGVEMIDVELVTRKMVLITADQQATERNAPDYLRHVERYLKIPAPS
jgi:hypothetical protein